MLRVHRQLQAACTKAEIALELAYRGRAAIEDSISVVHGQLEALRSGCVDLDLEDVLIATELSLLNHLRQLERFERDVAQPAEQLYLDATFRLQAFEDQLARKRSERPSGFRTRPAKTGRSSPARFETQLA